MNQLVRNWWLLALRGVIAILAGVFAVLLPGATLVAMVLLFGAYAFVDGVAMLAAGLRKRSAERKWWSLILQGLAGIAAGLITVFVPLATALALLAVVVAWAMLSGALQIAAAVRLRREIEGEWLLIVSGLLSLLLGVALLLMPGAGLLALAWMVGAYLVASGAVFLALAFRLRRYGGELPTMRRQAARA